jgi:hypothetical protein
LPVIMFCAQLEWLKESKKINTHHPSTQWLCFLPDDRCPDRNVKYTSSRENLWATEQGDEDRRDSWSTPWERSK